VFSGDDVLTYLVVKVRDTAAGHEVGGHRTVYGVFAHTRMRRV